VLQHHLTPALNPNTPNPDRNVLSCTCGWTELRHVPLVLQHLAIINPNTEPWEVCNSINQNEM
jgi:hypothetical protein